MAERQWDKSSAGHHNVGEDETDSYSHAEGYLYLVRKLDHTGSGTHHYRIEVQPEQKPTYSRNRLSQQLCENHVTNMSQAERTLREAFEYNYHKSTQDGWFKAESQEEAVTKYQEVIKKWIYQD